MVISPAKSLDFTPPGRSVAASTPQMKDDVAVLAKVARKLRKSDLKRLMSISDNLATLNYERFQAFDPASEDGSRILLIDPMTDVDVSPLAELAITCVSGEARHADEILVKALTFVERHSDGAQITDVSTELLRL